MVGLKENFVIFFRLHLLWTIFDKLLNIKMKLILKNKILDGVDLIFTKIFVFVVINENHLINYDDDV